MGVLLGGGSIEWAAAVAVAGAVAVGDQKR